MLRTAVEFKLSLLVCCPVFLLCRSVLTFCRAKSYKNTLDTAEKLAAASEGGTRDVALQQREPRSERLEGPCAGAFGSFGRQKNG